MKKLSAVVLLLLMVIPLLEGCWNQRELTNLAFVMAVGVDKGTHNEKYDFSYQVVVPANVSTGLSGSSGQGPPVVVYNSTGNTLTEASRKVTKDIPRDVYFAHTSLLVISEEVARDGILDLIDFVDRDPVFRTTTLAIIAKNSKAEDLISTLTTVDKIPVNKFSKTLEATERLLGENIKVSTHDLLESIASQGKEPVASGFILNGIPEKGTSPQNINTTKPPAMIEADGLAVFKKGKLVGWLTHAKARGAIWAMNKMSGTYVSFNFNDKKDSVSMTPYLSKAHASVSFKNGQPSIDLMIETLFKLSEINTAYDISNPKNMEILEKKTAEQIKKDVEEAIRLTQKYKADIFGFGESVHRANPAIWRKIKKDWGSQFAKMDIRVNVNAYYREAGIRGNPFWMNLDK